MAKLAMTRISVCGLRTERKAVLEKLQRLGCIEVQNFTGEDEVFKKVRMPVTAGEFDRSVHDAEAALEAINTLDGTKAPGMLSSFHGRDVVEVDEYEKFAAEAPKVSRTVSRILELSKDVAEKKAEILKDSQQIEMLGPWEGLDVRLDLSGTEKTSIFIGALPSEWTLDAIYEGLAQVLPVDVTVISKSKEQTCIMVICAKENEAEVGPALRAMGFVYPSVDTSLTPVEEEERLKGEIAKLEAQVKEEEAEIISYAPEKPKIKFYMDYQTVRAEKYAVTSSIPQSENTFILTGYTPKKCLPAIEEALKDNEVFIETSEPEADEDVPVLLSNNAYSEHVQGVVESYALPLKHEIDPSFLISIFYPIFFGFMLSDAAIGFLIFAGALFLLLKNKNMEKGLRRNVKLFCFGGISAMFWGVMFGSYFGDFIPVVSETFFGKGIVVKPVWLDMTTNPMTVLALALGLGLIHIFTGMAVAAYQFAKQKDWAGFFFDVITWYVVLIGLIIKALSMPMIMSILFAGQDPFFTDQIGNIGLYAAGIGCIVLVIFAGRSSKNIGKRLLKGIYAVYGITGYLSDLLSYSRLLALGLATGVISQVANMIGTMFGSGFVKVIVFILVFLIINAINIGINTLGAYVHTNRLQYVEFFGRFYSGGGRPFAPYSIKTKYYKFKEN